MKKISLVFLTSIMLLPLIIFARNRQALLKPYPLRIGETMRYEVKVLGIVGIRITMHLYGKKDYRKVRRYFGRRQAYRAQMIIRTYDWVRKLYNMEDRLTTYMDAKTLLPLIVYKKVREGRFHNKVRVIFRHKQRIALYSDTHKKRFNKKYPILPQTLDLVSLIYYVRQFQSTSHNVGRKLDISYLSGPRLEQTKVIFRKHVNKKAPIYFQAFKKKWNVKYRHSRISQIGSHGVSFYITDDKWRVPTFFIAESIQYKKRVKLKGINLSKFMNLGAYLEYYGIIKL